MDSKREDMSFSGRGVLGSGDYGDLRFSGSGTINGDITCTSFSCSGSVTSEGSIGCETDFRCSGAFRCKGSVKTKEFNSSGSSHIDGNLEAGEMESSGSVRVSGDLMGGSFETSGSLEVRGSIYCNSLESSGSIRVGTDLKAEEIETHGSLRVKGDCEAEDFDSSGRLEIEGLLNAGNIDIQLGKTDSRIGEIGGESIEVRKAPSGFFGFSPLRGTLVTNSIEGDEIHLENTISGTVRGARVYIGAGCEIETVEYTNSFEKAEDAVVKNLVRCGEESV